MSVDRNADTTFRADSQFLQLPRELVRSPVEVSISDRLVLEDDRDIVGVYLDPLFEVLMQSERGVVIPVRLVQFLDEESLLSFPDERHIDEAHVAVLRRAAHQQIFEAVDETRRGVLVEGVVGKSKLHGEARRAA